MSIWVIDEAEEFIIINCCDYSYYKEIIEPPWVDIEEEEFDFEEEEFFLE